MKNIITRVTGGSESRIDGLLRSEIPGANLFFLNPAGVMFGPHASLDISGSFHVSTADYLVLGKDVRFDTRRTAPSILTSEPPSAFGFLGETTGSGSVEDHWRLHGISVPQGETLSVIGGDIRMNLSLGDVTCHVSSSARLRNHHRQEFREQTPQKKLGIRNFKTLQMKGKQDILWSSECKLRKRRRKYANSSPN